MTVAGAGGMPKKSTVLLINLGFVGLGLFFLLLALCTGPAWAEQHLMPAWHWSWAAQMRILLVVRLLSGALGLAILLLVRPWFLRACRAKGTRSVLASAAAAMLAVVAALVVTELVLRSQTWRSSLERWDKLPVRVRDSEYGWAFAPYRVGKREYDSRMVHFATGPFGYRVSRGGTAPDFSKPTIVFAGESLMFGYGLQWSETLPAQVQALTGIQTANIAVHALSTDQTYMRLRRELPRFSHPIAVVVPFMPRLLDRNLDDDKPHLDANLVWHKAGRPPLRLVELARRLVGYRSSSAIAQGEAMTQTVLKATISLANARGARAIVIVPQYLPEAQVERNIRRNVLDNAGIPYLLVPIPLDQRSPAHGHPKPAGARALAEAVSIALDEKSANTR